MQNAYLIEHGADVNILNNRGQTPLMLIASPRERWLDEFQNYPTWYKPSGNNITWAQKKDLAVLEALLQRTRDFHRCDTDGNNLLHLYFSSAMQLSGFVEKVLAQVPNLVNQLNKYNAAPIFEVIYCNHPSNTLVTQKLCKEKRLGKRKF